MAAGTRLKKSGIHSMLACGRSRHRERHPGKFLELVIIVENRYRPAGRPPSLLHLAVPSGIAWQACGVPPECDGWASWESDIHHLTSLGI